MADAMITGLFRSLVARAGGVDAAAAAVEARWGCGHKGTISKMITGQLAVTVEAIVALEDFTGGHPVTDWMAARSLSAGAAAMPALAETAAEVAVASGGAHAAIVRALAASGPGGAAVTAAERADILARWREVRTFADQIIAVTEAPAFVRSVPLRGAVS